MRKIAPFSRTRVIVSIAIGLVVFAVQAISVWKIPTGDEPAKIKQADALLEQFRRGLQTDGSLYTVQAPDGREITVFAHTAPTQSRLAQVFGSLTNEGEHKLIVQVPEYNTTVTFPEHTTPAEIRDALRNRFPPEKVDVNRSWKDVEAASRELIWLNGVLLRAKAMQYLPANPDSSVESYEWNNRFDLALRSLSVCTKADHVRNSVGLGLVAFVVSTPLAWLALLVLAWIWYSVLDRFRGLPRALPGEERGE
jgi:hypothetical protein